MKGLHPRTIIDGYQKACEKAVAIANAQLFHSTFMTAASLRKVALTAMSSKISHSSVQLITDLVTKATENSLRRKTRKAENLTYQTLRLKK